METANTVGVPKSSAITVIVICIIIYLIQVSQVKNNSVTT